MTEHSRTPFNPAGVLAVDDYRQLFYAFEQGFCVLELLLDDDGMPVDLKPIDIEHLKEVLGGLRPEGRGAAAG
jgi:hypothetical protein